MKFPGFITISRILSNREDDTISITVIDAVSRCEFVEILVSVEDFGFAITGRSEVDCKVEFREKAPLGKRRETKVELIPEPKEYKEKPEEYVPLLAPFEVEGWKGQVDTLYNSHNSATGPNGESMRRVTFVRYVDQEETA